MSNNRKLILSSEGQPSNNFTIDYNVRLNVETQLLVNDDRRMEPVQKIVTYLVGLDVGYVPNLISNINSRYGNNQISYTYQSETVDLTIDPGLYNIEQLYEWLQEKLREKGHYVPPNELNGFEEIFPIKITKSSSSGKVTIYVDNDTSLTINDKLADMLGFSGTLFNSGVHVSDLPSNMGVSTPINIHCDLVNNNWYNEYKSDVIATFLPSRTYGEMMNITPIHKSYFPMNCSHISQINIRLTYAGTNNEVVFDRDEPVILHLHIKRVSI